jgi:hypothetical protein
MTTPVGNNSGRGRLPIASRDRRPALAALALLLIVAGGLGAGLIVYRTGQQTDVLVSAKNIPQGKRLETSDFTTVRISGGGDQSIDARNEDKFVGTTAVTAIHGGTLLNRYMFRGGGVVPNDGQLVGLDLAVGQRTATNVTAGGIVQVWQVAKAGEGVTPQAIPLGRKPVLVYQVHSASGDGTVHMDVLVANDDPDLPKMVSNAALNQIAVTQHSLGTKPELELTNP